MITPAEIEAMCRRLCVELGQDPNETMVDPQRWFLGAIPVWTMYVDQVRMAIAMKRAIG